MLTDRQLRAVRYYIGDVSGIDPFWGDGKAYVALNALFFPGIETEKNRAGEGKYLNPAILEDTDRLTELLSDLLSAFNRHKGAVLTTYRVERYADYRYIEERKSTVSFTSTSTAGFLSSYTDRKEIVLMSFNIFPDVPCLDISSELPYYAKEEEAEILLPPGLELEISEVELSQDELTMKDSDGKPPLLSVSVVPFTKTKAVTAATSLPAGGNEAGIRVYKALNSHSSPGIEDIRLFSEWKSAFTSSLLSR